MALAVFPNVEGLVTCDQAQGLAAARKMAIRSDATE